MRFFLEGVGKKDSNLVKTKTMICLKNRSALRPSPYKPRSLIESRNAPCNKKGDMGVKLDQKLVLLVMKLRISKALKTQTESYELS